MSQMEPLRPICELSIGRGFALSLLILVSLCIAVIAQAEDPVKPEGASLPPVAKDIMERTKREFRKARFYKPAERDSSEIEDKLAPLIVEEFNSQSKFLSRLEDPSGQPVVYVKSGSVLAEGQKLTQIVFVWWYRVGDPVVVRQPFTYRGVRIVLGSDGMPCLWEALNPLSPPRVFFVSQSLEAAAMKQFGPPLPGRTFSIERSIEETERVVVAATLDDGPVPMGPYVYVDASPRRVISTIHCRCSSSQFEEAIETLEYRPEPFEQMASAFYAGQRRIDVESAPLQELFRWPKYNP
jgi:hypothetical protein